MNERLDMNNVGHFMTCSLSTLPNASMLNEEIKLPNATYIDTLSPLRTGNAVI